MKRFLQWTSLAAACVAAINAAHSAPLAANLVRAPLVAPATAWSYYGSATTHTPGLAAWTALPLEMEALARTLGKGRAAGHVYVTNVFEYVRNNIETEFRFGLGKGGRGALIDQSGTAFDQAELMVKLLRTAGISASYKVGTITLTAQQFGQWTGLFATLTESTQAVTVDAQAACQLLADGAIPGSCAPATGALTSITLGHIYVSATYQDSTGATVTRFFDPAFKPSTLFNGIDIPAAMGCGTASASTCGTGMMSAAMTGAVSSTAALNGVTAPYVQNLNETQLNSWLQSRATGVQTQIQNTNRHAPLEQIVGGRQLTLSPTPAPVASLPYIDATQMTWTGDIPDQFRTKLRVRAGGDRTFFADELAGRRLQLTTLRGVELDGTTLAAAPCSTCVAGVLLDVDHPYATAGYADESQTFTLFQFPANFVSWPQNGTLPATIIHGFGNASSSTERHYAALQEVLPKSHGIAYDSFNGPNPTHTELAFENKEQALIAIRALAQASVADRLIAGISRSVIIRHHTFGIAYTHSSNPAALNSLSMQPALSVVSATNDDTARRAAFETSASTFATVEGSVNQQLNSTDDGLSAATLFWVANLPGSGGVRQRFFEMSNAQLQAAFGNTPAVLAGYGSVFPEATGASILSKANSLGHLAGEMKGGAAITSDPLGKAMDTIKVAELAAARKKYLSVSPADGAATITETDLVTGVDDFPHALPFRRMYTSGTSVLDINSPMESYTFTTDSSEQSWRSNTYTLSYSGPDSAANSRIGGGWNHNYNITASYTGNGPKALGEDYALEASASIAALRAVYDAARSPTLAGRVSSMLASRWLAKFQWAFNSVVVNKGGAAESFSRLPDGGFFTPSGSARLVQAGTQTSLNDFSPVSFIYTGKHGDDIAFTVALFSKVPVCCNAQTKGEPVFKADTWRFADGTLVTFNYTLEYLISSGQQGVWPDVTCVSGSNCPPGAIHLPRGHVLRSVSNNLGRSLTFGITNTEIQTFVQTPQGANPDMLSSRFTITSVTDESGRSVQYNLSGCTPGLHWVCNRLTVTGPDGRASGYDYAPGADSPNPTAVTRDAYRLRRWFTPSDSGNAYRVVAYDELFHVRTVRDPLGNLTYHFPGGVMGSERWKRAETVSALGAASTQIFDDNNSLLKGIDPLGRTTTMTYDNANRLLATTHHEGDSVTHTYDVRSNVLSTVQRAKPNSGYGDLTTSATYAEGPTIVNCANWKRCNKPLTERDARNQPTTYTYSTTTGQLLTVLAPTVPLNGSNVSPLTTLCYTNQSGLSLLTGRIDKVNATTNRVRAYTYNASNKYVLQTVRVDPDTTLAPPTSSSLTCPTSTKSGALNLVTTLSFDGVGNLQSINGPRTDVTDVTNYTFDRTRRITKITASDTTTRYCYDADGLLRGTHRARVSGATDPNAATASTDGSCPTAYPPASWQSELRDYWATGDLRSAQDAELNITRYAYDSDGQLRVAQDPEGRQVATVYDLAGQVLATWKGGRTWLDGNGNLAGGVPGVTTPWDPLTYANAGSEGPFRYSAQTYTGNGKQKSVQDANNNTTEYIYDGRDRLFFTFFPHPTTGARCTVTPPITSSTAPTCTASGGIAPTYERSTYDANGNLLTFRTRRANTITRTYDNANRVRTKAAPSLGTVTYDYNLVNEPMSVASPASGSIPAHAVAYDYDAAGGKLFEENLINGTNRRVSYEHNQAGARQRTTWPDGYYVHYTYDELNRMQYARENSTSANELAYYDYDPLSRREQLRFAGTSGNRIDYTYEPDSNLDLLTNVLNTVTVSLNHGHNRAGQLNSIVANDDFYLPTPPVAPTTIYAANKLNQYSSVGGQNATYDLNGNLLTWFRNGVRQTYTYDAESRLRTAATDGTTTPSITYDYDALGRRISKTVGGTTTYYLLDGDEEIAEYNGADTVLRRYLMGPAIDDRIARAEGNATSNPPKTYYHVNHQGSVIATANPNGSIAQQLAYDEYGSLTSQQPPAATTGEPFRYTGRRYDDETKLYYYRARYYSPELGRFLQVDPVGYKDDFNLCAYVGNDPVNRIDPSGKCFVGKCEDGTDSYMSGLADRAEEFGKGVVDSVEVKANVGLGVGASVDAGPLAQASVEVAGSEAALSTTPTAFFERDVRYTESSAAPGNTFRNKASIKVLGLTVLKADNGETKDMSSASPNVRNEITTSYGDFKAFPELGGPGSRAELSSRDDDSKWRVGASVKLGVGGVSIKINLHQLFDPYDRSH